MLHYCFKTDAHIVLTVGLPGLFITSQVPVNTVRHNAQRYLKAMHTCPVVF